MIPGHGSDDTIHEKLDLLSTPSSSQVWTREKVTVFGFHCRTHRLPIDPWYFPSPPSTSRPVGDFPSPIIFLLHFCSPPQKYILLFLLLFSSPPQKNYCLLQILSSYSFSVFLLLCKQINFPSPNFVSFSFSVLFLIHKKRYCSSYLFLHFFLCCSFRLQS